MCGGGGGGAGGIEFHGFTSIWDLVLSLGFYNGVLRVKSQGFVGMG